MTRFRLPTCVLIGVAVAAAAAAEDLSLEGALEIALADSPQMAAARAEVERAELGERAAGSASWPTLSVSGSYGSFSGDVLYGRFIPGVPGDGAMAVGPYDRNATAGVELKQVLYAGGGIDAAKRASDVNGRMAEEALQAHRRELSYQVSRTYFEVLLAERRLAVASESIERSQEGLDMIKKRFSEQEALQVEVFGAEGQLAADQLALLEATNDVELARRSLNRLLGRPQDAAIHLSDPLDRGLEVPPEATAVDEAVTTSADVRSASLGVELADAALGSAKALSRPKLELSAVYTWLDNELFFKGQYVGAAVNVSLPFLQAIKAGSAAKGQARARRAQADAILDDATSAAKLQMMAAYRKLAEAVKAVDVAGKNLEYHRERYRVTQSAFREDMVTFSEVLDRHDDLKQAELALSGALFQSRLQEAEIRRLAGSV